MALTSSLSRFVRRSVPRPGVYRRPGAPSSPTYTAGGPGPAAPLAPLAPVAPSFAAPDLGPEDIQYFQSARNRVQQSRDLALGVPGMTGQVQFDRTQLGLDKAQQVADLARRFDQMRQKLPGHFASRGLLNSGIAAQGLQDYGVDRTLAEAGLNRAYDRQFGGLDLEQSQIQATYDQTIADLKAQEEARRASIRASLSGF